ncbi:unnamed protein product [Chilo suppressalis]|uniref:DUF4371 domain-containing protein n=1 Tax=Chilo suppressalis TaxID=168631 RepID=A0ABN8AZA8_CHISP|nr:unnamed protein product [Chilo suppressalis]
MCLVVRYAKMNRIKDCFLALIPLEEANAATIFEHIVNFFRSNNIPYKHNLIGFTSDGANVMMGRNNSVVILLQKEILNIFILKCACHSFHLCASYACTKLPRFIEDLAQKEWQSLKTFKCFQNTHLKHAGCKYYICEENIGTILCSKTIFFRSNLLAAEYILQKLQDPTTILFMEFLDFVLLLFTGLNKEMQSEHPKMHNLKQKENCSTTETR